MGENTVETVRAAEKFESVLNWNPLQFAAAVELLLLRGDDGVGAQPAGVRRSLPTAGCAAGDTRLMRPTRSSGKNATGLVAVASCWLVVISSAPARGDWQQQQQLQAATKSA